MIPVFDLYPFIAVYLICCGSTKMANKDKINKHLSKVDIFSKASKKQQHIIRSLTDYLMLSSQYATKFSADQTVLAGQANHCEWQFFTHNNPTKAVTDLSSDKTSLTENLQLQIL